MSGNVRNVRSAQPAQAPIPQNSPPFPKPATIRAARGSRVALKMLPMLKPIEWTGSAVRVVDQTKLPLRTEYVEITDEKQMHDAIRRLVVRGAPLIGIAAAFGVYLGVRGAADVSARAREVT